jgi:signal transduction histidine kinase
MSVSLRPSSSFKKITAQFIRELVQGLSDGKHFAIIAPRQSGKAALLYELKRQGAKLPEADRPRVWIVRSLDFRDMTENQFLTEFAKRLSLATWQVEQCLQLPPSEAIRQLICEAVNADRSPCWLFVQNIAEFSWPYARAILEALHACSEDLIKRLSAVVTGNQGFISLTYHENSPYRHAEKIFLQGFDRELTHSYFRARAAGVSLEAGFDEDVLKDIFKLSDSALDYLYQESGGYALFIDEIRRSLTRPGTNLSTPLSAGVPERELLGPAAHRFIQEFMDFDVYCKLSLRDVQRDREAWDILQEILFTDGKVTTVSGSQPHLLETAGIVRRDAGRKLQFSSPIWHKYLKKRLSTRYRADIYAILGNWEQAWPSYEAAAETSICDRPLDGEDRYILNRALKSWEESLIDASSVDSKEVIRRFEQGVRHLYGCESCVLYDRGVKQVISSFPAETTWREPGERSITFDNGLGLPIRISNARTTLHCSPDNTAAYTRIELHPEVLLTRDATQPLDSSTLERLQHSLKRFWQSLLAARRIEYDTTLGYMRDKHLRVVELVNQLLASHTTDFKHVVEKTVEAIVEVAHYYRVMVCLVSPDGTRIQSVASRCVEPEHDFKCRTDYELAPNTDSRSWDIQQWVVIRGEVSSVEDATEQREEPPLANVDQARLLGMRAICVLPLIVPRDGIPQGEVLGTLHLERSDRRPLTSEEVKACEILASQIAVAFDVARRLSMLQMSLCELDDDFEIISPDGRQVFLNHGTGHRGSQNRIAQWKFPITQIGSGGTSNRAVAKVVEDAVSCGQGVHRYERDNRRRLPRARDDFAAPIQDFRADIPGFPKQHGKVGYVRLTHDISDLVQMNEALHKWLTASDPRKTANRIQRYLRRNRFRWCRIYLLKHDQALGTRLESFAEFGIKDKRVAEDFRKGAYCVPVDSPDQQASVLIRGLKGMALVKHDPQFKGPPRRDDKFGRGIPSLVTNDSWRIEFGKVDPSWVEAPLIVGGKCIGLIALSLPTLAPNDEIMSPQTFEKLQWCVMSIAVALNTSLHAEEGLKQQEFALRTASYMATHQLANKLGPSQSAVYSARQLLESAAVDLGFVREQLDLAYENIEASRGIVRRFLDYANNRPFPDIAAKRVGEVIADAVASIHRDYESLAITVVNDCPTLEARMSPSAIIEVLEILAHNAVRHSGLPIAELQCCLRVSATSEENRVVEIAFQNNGRRLTDCEEVFKPFMTTHAQGNGLGLSVARRLLERQQGTIVADSKCQDGAAFIIRVPAVGAQEKGTSHVKT